MKYLLNAGSKRVWGIKIELHSYIITSSKLLVRWSGGEGGPEAEPLPGHLQHRAQGQALAQLPQTHAQVWKIRDK